MIARDGEAFAIRAGDGDWVCAWHPPSQVPDGTNHGAAAVCVTPDNEIVLISRDGQRWELPGGRPEGGETWEETLRREMLEETCCTVRAVRLLGFSRGECLSGSESGLVLVRSLWRAEVEVLPWEPRFEIAHRCFVGPDVLTRQLWIAAGFEPIIRRALAEAGVLRNS